MDLGQERASMGGNKVTRIRQSLLSAWQWSVRHKRGYEDFLLTLQGKSIPANPMMQNGIKFEELVRLAIKGVAIPADHEWYKGIIATSKILRGSAEQVYKTAPITVNDRQYLLSGTADNIKAGVIYDTKFSVTYKYGKYFDSPQHPAYFYLWPDAKAFQYLIFNGKELFRETYYPFAVKPIADYIADFQKYLDMNNLTEIYETHWRI